MRRSKLLLVLLIGLVFVVNLVLMVLCFSFAKRSQVALPELRSQIEQQLGIAITNIVDRIILDVGILKDSPQSLTSEDSKGEKKAQNDFVSADVKTLDGRVAWINGEPFYYGDLISPYGVVVGIGRDMVVLRHPSGASYVLARPLPEKVLPVPKDAREGGSAGTSPAAPPSLASAGSV